jgi:hypothetical protein
VFTLQNEGALSIYDMDLQMLQIGEEMEHQMYEKSSLATFIPGFFDDKVIRVWDEDVLRFWVGVKANIPMWMIGSGVYANLILEPLNPEKPTITIRMMRANRSDTHLEWFYVDISHGLASHNWSTQQVGQYGETDISVYHTDFGVGAWKVAVEVYDPRGDRLDTYESPKRLWHIGSSREFFGALESGAFYDATNPVSNIFFITKNIATTVVYLVSAGLVCFEKTRAIGQVLSISVTIANIILDTGIILVSVKEKRAGLLGGLIWANLFRVAMIGIGRAVNLLFSEGKKLYSKITTKLGVDPKGILNSIMQYIWKIQSAVTFALTVFNFFVDPVSSLLIYLPMFLLSTIAAISSSHRYLRTFLGIFSSMLPALMNFLIGTSLSIPDDASSSTSDPFAELGFVLFQGLKEVIKGLDTFGDTMQDVFGGFIPLANNLFQILRKVSHWIGLATVHGLFGALTGILGINGISGSMSSGASQYVNQVNLMYGMNQIFILVSTMIAWEGFFELTDYDYLWNDSF